MHGINNILQLGFYSCCHVAIGQCHWHYLSKITKWYYTITVVSHAKCTKSRTRRQVTKSRVESSLESLTNHFLKSKPIPYLSPAVSIADSAISYFDSQSIIWLQVYEPASRAGTSLRADRHRTHSERCDTWGECTQHLAYQHNNNNLYYNSPYGFCLSLCVAYLGSLQTEF